jgi:hypothetical protein
MTGTVIIEEAHSRLSRSWRAPGFLRVRGMSGHSFAPG